MAGGKGPPFNHFCAPMITGKRFLPGVSCHGRGMSTWQWSPPRAVSVVIASGNAPSALARQPLCNAGDAVTGTRGGKDERAGAVACRKESFRLELWGHKDKPAAGCGNMTDATQAGSSHAMNSHVVPGRQLVVLGSGAGSCLAFHPDVSSCREGQRAPSD
jgi:hypothetical protein